MAARVPGQGVWNDKLRFQRIFVQFFTKGRESPGYELTNNAGVYYDLRMLYLSDIGAELPEEERRRLERRLGVLLRHPDRKMETCRSLVEKIQRDYVPRECAWLPLFLKYGDPLPPGSLSPAERKEIAQAPLVNIQGQVYLPAEFLEAWKSQRTGMKHPFLFSAIHRLKLSEKQAFLLWLRRHTDYEALAHLPFRSVGMRLYLLIRQLRREWIEPPETAALTGPGPWKLEDIFGELWGHPPLYWYDREIVPFYQSVQDLEKELTRRHRKAPASLPLIKHVYYGLRTGSYCLVEEEQGFGKRLQPMLSRTEDFPANSPALTQRELMEDRLF